MQSQDEGPSPGKLQPTPGHKSTPACSRAEHRPGEGDDGVDNGEELGGRNG